MLTKLLLAFRDADMKVLYARHNFSYYARSVIIITVMLFLIGLSLELANRTSSEGAGLKNGLFITVVCLSAFLIFFIMCFAIRKSALAQHFVCPLLTVYVSFLAILIEPEEGLDAATLFTRGSISTAALLYVLAMFNECWAINLGVFTVCTILSLVQTGQQLGGYELDIHQLILITLFQVFIYASIGYKTERLSKNNFIGHESHEKSFHRWLQLFDTFPEGIAIVKDDGSIMYSNDSLARLFDSDVLPRTNASHYSKVGITADHADQARKMLENVRVRHHEEENQDARPHQVQETNNKKEYSVWDFLIKNVDAATFEVMSSHNVNATVPDDQQRLIPSSPQQAGALEESKGAGDINQSNSQLIKIKDRQEAEEGEEDGAEAQPQRFLSLNQVKVGNMGTMEKILIAREESVTVALRELVNTRRFMIEFTQNMMCLVDDYANLTSQNLKQLIEACQNSGQLDLLKDCLSVMARARYSIRDFQYIHDVAEHNFAEPVFKCVDIRSSLDEMRRVTENDSQKLGIELSSNVNARVPRFVAVEENVFIQVMINLLRMAMDTIVNRGYIKLHTFVALRRHALNLVIDFELSSCKLEDRERLTINRLAFEKDFKRVLSADVEPHFKIAKILCNQLGWRIDFDTNRDLRYKLSIPLTQQPSPEEELAMAEEDVDIGKEDEPQLAPGIQAERIIVSQKSERNARQRKQFDSDNSIRQARPLTVDESYQLHKRKYFEPVQEAPEGLEDIEEGINQVLASPPMETQSFRDDSRSCGCAKILLMNSDQKELIEDTLNVKCHEKITINEVVNKIRTSLQLQSKKCSCRRGYKFLVIDTQNMPQKLELRYLLQKIGPVYQQLANEEHSGTVHELDIIVFWIDNNGLNSPDLLRQDALGANIQFFQKPINAREIKSIFSEQNVSRMTSNTKTSATIVETTEPH